MKLAMLSHERERLCQEMAHWERRIERIKRRLGEIAQAEEWLRGFIGQADPLSEQRDSGAEERRDTPEPLLPNSSAQSDPHEITFRY